MTTGTVTGMSNRHLVLPEIKRMLEESKKRQEITYSEWYEEGYQDALRDVEKLLLGIGVKVQSVTYPEQGELL